MKRRDFLKQAAAMAAIGVGGCMAGGRGSRNAAATRGVVVSAHDLSGAFDWPHLAHDAGLTTIATHIGPRDVIPFWSTSFTPSTGSFRATCSPPIPPYSE